MSGFSSLTDLPTGSRTLCGLSIVTGVSDAGRTGVVSPPSGVASLGSSGTTGLGIGWSLTLGGTGGVSSPARRRRAAGTSIGSSCPGTTGLSPWLFGVSRLGASVFTSGRSMVVGSPGFVSSSGRSRFSGCADCTGASTLLGLKSRGAGSSVIGNVESTKPYAGLLGFSKSIAALLAAASSAFASAAASSLLNAFSLAALIFPGVPTRISPTPIGPSATVSRAISPGV